jgi:hypothetical protein
VVISGDEALFATSACQICLYDTNWQAASGLHYIWGSGALPVAGLSKNAFECAQARFRAAESPRQTLLLRRTGTYAKRIAVVIDPSERMRICDLGFYELVALESLAGIVVWRNTCRTLWFDICKALST